MLPDLYQLEVSSTRDTVGGECKADTTEHICPCVADIWVEATL